MDLGVGVDATRALVQHQALVGSLSAALPTFTFPGRADTPDAIFPNNVFATARGRLILGHMRHPVRQAEAQREDIRSFFRDLLGYEELDLATQPGVCELTGSLVIDHRRRIGYCGLGERCDEAGARAMHAAFGLRASCCLTVASARSMVATAVASSAPSSASWPTSARSRASSQRAVAWRRATARRCSGAIASGEPASRRSL